MSLAPVPLTRCPGTFIKFQNLCSNLNSHLNNVHQLRHLSIELRFQRHLIFWFVASELPRWNPATSAALQTLRMPLGEPPSNPSKAKRLGRQEAMMHLARMAAHDVPECSVGGGFIRDRIVHGMPATDVDVLVTHDARQTNAAAAVRKAAESFVKTLKTWGLHHHSTRTKGMALTVAVTGKFTGMAIDVDFTSRNESMQQPPGVDCSANNLEFDQASSSIKLKASHVHDVETTLRLTAAHRCVMYYEATQDESRYARRLVKCIQSGYTMISTPGHPVPASVLLKLTKEQNAKVTEGEVPDFSAHAHSTAPLVECTEDTFVVGGSTCHVCTAADGIGAVHSEESIRTCVICSQCMCAQLHTELLHHSLQRVGHDACTGCSDAYKDENCFHAQYAASVDAAECNEPGEGSSPPAQKSSSKPEPAATSKQTSKQTSTRSSKRASSQRGNGPPKAAAAHFPTRASKEPEPEPVTRRRKDTEVQASQQGEVLVPVPKKKKRRRKSVMHPLPNQPGYTGGQQTRSVPEDDRALHELLLADEDVSKKVIRAALNTALRDLQGLWRDTTSSKVSTQMFVGSESDTHLKTLSDLHAAIINRYQRPTRLNKAALSTCQSACAIAEPSMWDLWPGALDKERVSLWVNQWLCEHFTQGAGASARDKDTTNFVMRPLCMKVLIGLAKGTPCNPATGPQRTSRKTQKLVAGSTPSVAVVVGDDSGSQPRVNCTNVDGAVVSLGSDVLDSNGTAVSVAAHYKATITKHTDRRFMCDQTDEVSNKLAQRNAVGGFAVDKTDILCLWATGEVKVLLQQRVPGHNETATRSGSGKRKALQPSSTTVQFREDVRYNYINDKIVGMALQHFTHLFSKLTHAHVIYNTMLIVSLRKWMDAGSSAAGDNKILRLTQKRWGPAMFARRYVCVPVNIPKQHWWLAVFDLKNEKLLVLDSIKGRKARSTGRRKDVSALLRWLELNRTAHSDQPAAYTPQRDVSKFTVELVNVPQQTDGDGGCGSDCALHLISNALAIILGTDASSVQYDEPRVRESRLMLMHFVLTGNFITEHWQHTPP